MDPKQTFAATQTVAFGRARSELPWLAGVVLISIAVHVGAIASTGAGRAAARRRVRPATLVSMTVAAPPAPSTAATQQASSPARRLARRSAPPRPTKAAAAAPAATGREARAETPADFTGVTLTN